MLIYTLALPSHPNFSALPRLCMSSIVIPHSVWKHLSNPNHFVSLVEMLNRCPCDRMFSNPDVKSERNKLRYAVDCALDLFECMHAHKYVEGMKLLEFVRNLSRKQNIIHKCSDFVLYMCELYKWMTPESDRQPFDVFLSSDVIVLSFFCAGRIPDSVLEDEFVCEADCNFLAQLKVLGKCLNDMYLKMKDKRVIRFCRDEVREFPLKLRDTKELMEQCQRDKVVRDTQMYTFLYMRLLQERKKLDKESVTYAKDWNEVTECVKVVVNKAYSVLGETEVNKMRDFLCNEKGLEMMDVMNLSLQKYERIPEWRNDGEMYVTQSAYEIVCSEGIELNAIGAYKMMNPLTRKKNYTLEFMNRINLEVDFMFANRNMQAVVPMLQEVKTSLLSHLEFTVKEKYPVAKNMTDTEKKAIEARVKEGIEYWANQMEALMDLKMIQKELVKRDRDVWKMCALAEKVMGIYEEQYSTPEAKQEARERLQKALDVTMKMPKDDKMVGSDLVWLLHMETRHMARFLCVLKYKELEGPLMKDTKLMHLEGKVNGLFDRGVIPNTLTRAWLAHYAQPSLCWEGTVQKAYLGVVSGEYDFSLQHGPEYLFLEDYRMVLLRKEFEAQEVSLAILVGISAFMAPELDGLEWQELRGEIKRLTTRGDMKEIAGTISRFLELEDSSIQDKVQMVKDMLGEDRFGPYLDKITHKRHIVREYARSKLLEMYKYVMTIPAKNALENDGLPGFDPLFAATLLVMGKLQHRVKKVLIRFKRQWRMHWGIWAIRYAEILMAM